MRLRSIGDQIAPGTYTLHSRFARAVNFIRGPRLVCVVEEEIGPGPLNIVASGVATAEAAPVLQVTAGEVLWGAERLGFSAGNRYDSEIRVSGFDAVRYARNLCALRTVLVETAPAQSLAFLLRRRSAEPTSAFQSSMWAEIEGGVGELFAGELLTGVRMLRGCGIGLTPAGDDFLAGLLIALNVIEKTHGNDLRATIGAVLNAARGDNVFSNAFLTMAANGRVFEILNRLLDALLHGDETKVCAAARRLFAVGATSGADIATGLLMTLSNARTFCSAENAVSPLTQFRSSAPEVRA